MTEQRYPLSPLASRRVDQDDLDQEITEAFESLGRAVVTHPLSHSAELRRREYVNRGLRQIIRLQKEYITVLREVLAEATFDEGDE